MVMPVSFKPHQGVTLIRWMRSSVPEALAQLPLNPRLCGVRLHIQVHTQQRERREPDEHRGQDERDAARLLHAGNLRSASLKKRLKPERSAT